MRKHLTMKAQQLTARQLRQLQLFVDRGKEVFVVCECPALYSREDFYSELTKSAHAAYPGETAAKAFASYLQRGDPAAAALYSAYKAAKAPTRSELTWMRCPTSVIGGKADMARTCRYVR